MRMYSELITLTKNSRGVYSLDPVLGCGSGMKLGVNGCYSECYAAKNARLYGYDFSIPVKRSFLNDAHVASIIRDIRRADMPFISIR